MVTRKSGTSKQDSSATVEEYRTRLVAGQGDYAGADAADPDEYKAENVFRVPLPFEAHWCWTLGEASVVDRMVTRPALG